MFPYYKAKHITAFIDDAPQANNPEYGLRLIIDFIKSGKLKFYKHIEFFNKLLPITEEIMKTGLKPEINALRFVLAAYDTNPIYNPAAGGSVRFTNFDDRNKTDTDWSNGYKEVYVEDE